ncbi:hypothetical protein BN1723_019536, partial [Verticillium longisporum]
SPQGRTDFWHRRRDWPFGCRRCGLDQDLQKARRGCFVHWRRDCRT